MKYRINAQRKRNELQNKQYQCEKFVTILQPGT